MLAPIPVVAKSGTKSCVTSSVGEHLSASASGAVGISAVDVVNVDPDCVMQEGLDEVSSSAG